MGVSEASLALGAVPLPSLAPEFVVRSVECSLCISSAVRRADLFSEDSKGDGFEERPHFSASKMRIRNIDGFSPLSRGALLILPLCHNRTGRDIIFGEDLFDASILLCSD